MYDQKPASVDTPAISSNVALGVNSNSFERVDSESHTPDSVTIVPDDESVDPTADTASTADGTEDAETITAEKEQAQNEAEGDIYSQKVLACKFSLDHFSVKKHNKAQAGTCCGDSILTPEKTYR
jgi:hypothetical protein